MVTRNDAWNDAMEKEWNPTLTVFGLCSVDVWYCILEKGQGKVPFDANQHAIERRCTAIEIAIQPLPGSRYTNPTERGMIAESREWSQIVKPSLRALQSDLRAINGRYVRAELVPTGQKYTNSSGETKDRTSVKFIEIYDSEDECQAAADAFFATRGSGSSSSTSSAPPSSSGGTPMPTNGSVNANSLANNSPINDAERATAAKFLPALWNASGKDVTKFATSLASNPLTSKYFSINSQEVIDLISPF